MTEWAVFYFPIVQPASIGLGPPHNHTQTHHTFGMTPLDEWSARRRDLYLTKLTRDRHPCPRRDSNPIILASKRLQNHALDRAATGIGKRSFNIEFNNLILKFRSVCNFITDFTLRHIFYRLFKYGIYGLLIVDVDWNMYLLNKTQSCWSEPCVY
jgi:hypothetical protein